MARSQGGCVTLKADICVIGAGSAGLTVAAAAANFGHKVVLVERGKMGGDCLNYGCVPSKSVIAAAKHAAMARDGARFGVHCEPRVDFSVVHGHVTDVIDTIAPHDSQERFEGLGVTVIRESARFVDERTLDAGSTRVKARRFVIASGSSPLVPPIDGLADCEPLTNETLFDLTSLPGRMAVIGGGPIGSEMAQAFARLGSAVTVIEGERLLGREDADAVEVVRAAMTADGVTIHEGVSVTACQRAGDVRTLTLSDGRSVDADAVLVAVGRTPNVADLDLAKAGVEFDKRGITVDKAMRTTNRRIYAIGDVTGGLQFTHVAGHQASLAVRAIVFRLPVTYDPDLMPRATYTQPELAQVGPTASDIEARGTSVTTRTAPLSGNDRAVTEDACAGFVKLSIDKKDRLRGATIVAPNAGEIANTYSLALAAKVPLSQIASFVPAYPTFGEAGKRAATEHYGKKLGSGWIKTALSVLKRI